MRTARLHQEADLERGDLAVDADDKRAVRAAAFQEPVLNQRRGDLVDRHAAERVLLTERPFRRHPLSRRQNPGEHLLAEVVGGLFSLSYGLKSSHANPVVKIRSLNILRLLIL